MAYLPKQYVETAFGTINADRPTVRVSKITTTSVPHGTVTPIPFDTERYDSDNMWSASTPTRITFNTPGTYTVGGSVQYATASVARNCQVYVRVNGASYLAVQQNLVDATAGTVYLTVSTQYVFAAGDYIDIFPYQETGTTLSLAAGTSPNQAACEFFASWVGGSGAAWGNAGASVYQTTGTSIPTGGAVQVISFDTEEFDTDGMHSNVTNNSRLTCTIPGVYLIEGGVGFESISTAGYFGATIQKNGVVVARTNMDAGDSGSSYARVPITKLLVLNVGDYVDLGGFQTTGGAVLTNTGLPNTRLSAVRVGYKQDDKSTLVPVPHARVAAQTAGQSITTGAITPVTYNLELNDTDNMVDLAVNNTRITINTPGVYSLSAFCGLANNGAGVRDVRVAHYSAAGGGLGTYTGDGDAGNGSQFYYGRLTEMVTCSVGDYFVLNIYHSAGSTLSTSGGNGSFQASMSLTWQTNTGAAWGNAGASAYGTTGQAVLAWTQLTINTGEMYDIDGMHSSSVNPTRLTCTVPGLYVGSAMVSMVGNATSQTRAVRALHYTAAGVQISPAGGYHTGYHEETSVSSSTWARTIAIGPIQMAVGDYLVLEAYCTVSSAINITPIMSVARVGYQTNPNKNGQLVSGGRSMSTANVTTGSIANAAYSTAILVPDLVLQGDGVNGMMLELTGYAPYLSAGTPAHWNAVITDINVPNDIGAQQFKSPVGDTGGGLCVRAYVPPFTGSKTFRYRINNTTGAAGTFWNQAAATQPTIFTATWTST